MSAELFRFDGKRALVVGGASGMGRASAELLRDLGAEVLVFDIAPVDIEGVTAFEVDIREPDAIDKGLANVGGPVHVILACAGWKDRVNMEDTLFAGAVVSRIKEHFTMNCDSSHMAECLYNNAKEDLYEFMKANDASHYHRLTGFGLERDIRHCLSEDLANVLPYYINERLVI